MFFASKVFWCVPSINIPEYRTFRNIAELFKRIFGVYLRPIKLARWLKAKFERGHWSDFLT